MSNQKRSLEERLKAHPHLKERIEKLLEIVEDASGDIDKADEAEQLVIKELQRLGNEVLHDWAIHKENTKVSKYNQSNDKSKRHGKKN